MQFFCRVFQYLFNQDEFLYQRERRKFHEAIAQGKKTNGFPIKIFPSTSFGVDVRDIVASQSFRDQREAVGRIFAKQHATS